MISRLVLLLVACTVVAVNADKVQVTIYYESLCPYSQKFFTTKLAPGWRDLKDYMDLELVPFGIADSTEYDDPSQPPPSVADVNFTCQHGPNECLGNKYQACVLNPEFNYDHDDRINYIDCLMRDAKRAIPYEKTVIGCAKVAGGISIETIKSCAEGVKGNELLLQHERTTYLFQRSLVDTTFHVPTIVFGNSYSETDEDEARKSFQTALCKHITDSQKPKICFASPHWRPMIIDNNSTASAVRGY